MKNHPMIGVDILRSLSSFREILPWIEYHHEKLDGTGYYGLPEDQIPYASKIIAVADTYSAITMRRSYKPPRSHEEAIRIMKEVSGVQLDPGIVDIICSIPKEELLKCVPSSVDVLDRILITNNE
jgi:HD-GYP domain-containing protein (c-di-GMP phosphodiesterase class II)